MPCTMRTLATCTPIYGNATKYTVVRYGPNRIVIDSEVGMQAIYGHGANVHKSNGYKRVSFVPNVHSTLSTLDDTKHKFFRRLMGQGLSDTNIRRLDDKMRSIASLFARSVGDEKDRFNATLEPAGDGWSVPKNMSHWCDYFTFDVMSELVFSTSYNLLTSSENHWIVDGVLGQMQRFGFLLQIPQLETFKMNHILFPEARRRAMRFTMKAREIMQARLARQKEGLTDVLGNMIAAKDPETGEGLPTMQLAVDSNLLIIAGSDTSSTGMAALFFYLSRNPTAYARLTNEIRSAFPNPNDVAQGPTINSCTYLRACIYEAIRLSPAVSGALWREVLAGGLNIPELGMHIPAGCEVGTGIWSLNHNPRYFPDPFKFLPERWITEESGEETVRIAKGALASFSVGPRNCVGKGLAITEISLAVAAVVSRYEFRRPVEGVPVASVGEGEGAFRGQFHTSWAFTSLKDGPYLQFREYVCGNA
ncbi:cytochrome P450 [Aspergillus karnatakaensis]|uniref:cytochrome P450 n=1 Tax=Aspergillus karnatakaensis TaxID=1810916 RepID=UPI003CCD3369